MNIPSAFLHCLRVAALSAACGLVIPALAGPGAHGPNGEHLDGNSAPASTGSAAPRFETKSELFELVGRLDGGELSILIDRFATNEPLLKAKVEVESGSLKATAKFHEDIGDYAVDDPKMLELLGKPGEHAIVVTVLAGAETDLLDGVLRATTAQAAAATGDPHGHGHDHAAGAGHGHGEHDDHGAPGWRRWGLWAAAALIAAAALLSWRWRNQSQSDQVHQSLNSKREGDQA